MKSINKHAAGLLVCIVLFLAAGFWIVKPKAPDMPAYLSFSADVDGTKAWRELLSRKHAHVKEWRLEWGDLPAGSGSALVVIEPEQLTDTDQDAMESWVRKGNDLLLFEGQPLEWSADWLQTETVVSPASSGPSAAVPIFTGAEATDGGYTGYVGTTERLLPAPGSEVLLRDAAGVLASRTALGAGSVTVALTPDWLSNSQIAEHSHFELVWPLFAKNWAVVWIDERHHGFAASRHPGLLAVYPAWLVLLSLQLALALLLWLWQRGKRFGPVHTPRAWTVRRGDETLLAVARWYERLGSREEALYHQQRLLRQLLAEHWGLSLAASPEQAAQAARARWPSQRAEQLVRLLAEPLPEAGGSISPAARRRGGRIGARAFVERTRAMGEIIAYLEKE